MLVLDFVRYHQHLTGTKIGCREGDCGACTVLIGELIDNQLRYRTATSCLTPIGNVHGKHVVTIEGINIPKQLNLMQHAMQQENATQCGFCTPGFVMSLAGFCLSDTTPTSENAIASIDGNICRCTGYKSIERAAHTVAIAKQSNAGIAAIDFAIQQNMVPAYFKDIEQRLRGIALLEHPDHEQPIFLGGGTDLYVQKHDDMVHAPVHLLFNQQHVNGITQQGNTCIIGASATVTDVAESPIIQKHFPRLSQYIKLVSSTPIRNVATIAGNLVNASPIGDMTIWFLALNATVHLASAKGQHRTVPLRNFYKGYKMLDKHAKEFIQQISFELPSGNKHFHFEKVCKRTHLDIASVNSAICLTINNEAIVDASISAGGVGPIPMHLAKTSTFLAGKIISNDVIKQAIAIAQTEVSPIGDVRGSEAYKRLLLGQLIKAHFIQLVKVE
jgi:xanthine dehydrogenase small subunit